MASRRVRRRHTLEDVERERQAEMETDREYTTPERAALIHGQPDLGSPGPEDGERLEARARTPLRGPSKRHIEADLSGAAFEADVDKRIAEEIDDFEREGSCAPRGGWPAVAAPAERGGDERAGREGGAEIASEPQVIHAGPAEGAAEPGGAGERATSGPRPEEHAITQPGAATQRGPQPARRIDWRTAAPDAYAAMLRLEAYARRCGLERPLLELVKLRASQINGCAYCVDMHTKDARRAGEAEQRLYTLAVWKETPFFTKRERAALAWTEAVTRLGSDHVGDRTFRMAREQFSEAEIVNLTMAIIAINGWNRLAIAFRAEPGSYHPPEGPTSPAG